MDKKELLVIYQDCITCGNLKNWGEKTIKSIRETGVKFRKVSFASAEAEKHAMKAIEHGVKGYPYITDGINYSQDIADFIKTEKPAKKTEKTTKRNKKGAKDGVIPEAN